MFVFIMWEWEDELNYVILCRFVEELEDCFCVVSGIEMVDIFGDFDEEIIVIFDFE